MHVDVTKSFSPHSLSPYINMDTCIKIFVVCLSMTDVGLAVTNLRVVSKIITCVSAFTEMVIIFLELLLVWTLSVAGYAKDTIVGACHRTSDGQEHKLFGMLDQNETRFFTYVTQRAESKAATVTPSD